MVVKFLTFQDDDDDYEPGDAKKKSKKGKN